MKIVAEYVAETWKEIPASTFHKSQHKILPITEETDIVKLDIALNADSARLVSEVSNFFSVQSELIFKYGWRLMSKIRDFSC